MVKNITYKNIKIKIHFAQLLKKSHISSIDRKTVIYHYEKICTTQTSLKKLPGKYNRTDVIYNDGRFYKEHIKKYEPMYMGVRQKMVIITAEKGKK